MFRFGPGLHHGPGVLAWLFLALLVAAVVLAVLTLVHVWSRPTRFVPPASGGPGPLPPDPALGELRIRYARGDITWEEFRRRAAHLGYPTPPDGGLGPPSQASSSSPPPSPPGSPVPTEAGSHPPVPPQAPPAR